jgi:prepilin peptidase CpaA
MPATLTTAVQIASLTLLVILLCGAALSDVRHRRIANGLCLAIAALALPYWIAADPHLVHRLAAQIALAGVIGLILLGAFAIDALGGGDVKMMAALLLWLTLPEAIRALFIASIGGALLAIVLLIRRRRTHSLREPTVPYGVAIAGAGLAQIAPRLIALIA